MWRTCSAKQICCGVNNLTSRHSSRCRWCKLVIVDAFSGGRLCSDARGAAALDGLLSACDPDVVGLSIRNVDTTDNLDRTSFLEPYRQVAEQIRRHSRAVLVLGGSGFTIFPEKILDLLGADFGVVGEGERLLPLLDALATGPVPVSDEAFALIAIVAVTNTALLALTTASRQVYGLAEQGAAPAVLARVGRRRTPTVAIVGVGGVVAVLAVMAQPALATRSTKRTISSPAATSSKRRGTAGCCSTCRTSEAKSSAHAMATKRMSR
mgnify:CR=1 FL=1